MLGNVSLKRWGNSIILMPRRKKAPGLRKISLKRHPPIFAAVLIVVIIAVAFFLKYRTELSVQGQTVGFAFGVAGDHGGKANFKSVIMKVGSFGESLNFFLNVGDLSYGNLTETVWSQTVKDNLNLGAGLPVGDNFGETFPFEIVSGNHDDDYSSGLIDNFTTYLPDRLNSALSPHYSGPSGTSNYGKEYYFDYPAGSPLARFILISPGLNFTNGGAYSYSTGSGRYNWVNDTIDAARNGGIRWVFVGMHRNCLSMGKHTCGTGSNVWNLLISKKVDLILQGHDHVYERSKQLAINTDIGCPTIPTSGYDPDCVVDDGSDNSYVKDVGSIFLIVGTGGRSLYSINTSEADSGNFASWMGATTGSQSQPPDGNGTLGFVHFTLTENQLTAQFIPAVGGNYTDNFTITTVGATPLPSSSESPLPSPGATSDPTPNPTPIPSPSPSPIPSPTPSPSSPPGTILTFTPTDDAYILQASPTSNFGSASKVSVDNSPVEQFLLKFVVSGINGQPVQSAILRLYNVNSSVLGGNFHKIVDNNWLETSVTWNTAPPADPAIIASLGSVVPNTWYDVDVSSYVTGDGTYSFRVDTTSGNGADYTSKEGAVGFGPQLIVDLP